MQRRLELYSYASLASWSVEEGFADMTSPKPTNPALWSKVKAAAKAKSNVYPSAKDGSIRKPARSAGALGLRSPHAPTQPVARPLLLPR